MKLIRQLAVAVSAAVLCSAAMADLKKGKQFYESGDYKSALAEFTAADTIDSAVAQSYIGLMYGNGQGIAKDESQAVVWYRKAAEQGNAAAGFNLGLMYAQGQGVVKDTTQAATWLRKAAEKGDPEMQTMLGRYYRFGDYVDQSDQLSLFWFKEAAKQGHTKAMRDIGDFYGGKIFSNSNTITPKDKEIFRREMKAWYLRADKNGDADALVELGGRYIDIGELDQAIFWYRESAKRGVAEGQYKLGFMYMSGRGVSKDREIAAKWYELAAIQGLRMAAYDLGYMHLRGDISNADPVVGLAWCAISISLDPTLPPDALKNNLYIDELSAAQVAEAQRLAREWKPGQPLGKSKLKLLSPNLLKTAQTAPQPQASNDPYPERPQGQPGVTTCRTSCTNGDCYRTYSDGRKKHFQAQRKWNPFNSQFEWDSGSC